MIIRKAKISDLNQVESICSKTIKDIFPHYYPHGVVEFLLKFHNSQNISDDIQSDKVFLCFDDENQCVGTLTIENNEIHRLFVLPQYQGYGYGQALLKYAEEIILKSYDRILLEASFPAKKWYLKKGYHVVEYQELKVDHDDVFCWDVMIKKINNEKER